MLATLYAVMAKLAVLSLLALVAGGGLILLGRFCGLANVSDAERPRARSLPPEDDDDPIEGLDVLVPYHAPDGERVLSDREMVAMRADLARHGVTL